MSSSELCMDTEQFTENNLHQIPGIGFFEYSLVENEGLAAYQIICCMINVKVLLALMDCGR